MAWFLGLGITGVLLLALSLVFDGVLDSVLDGALDAAFDGWLSFPVVAALLAMTGFGGALALEAMHKKADAYQRYGDAAILQMLVEVLPEVVAKACEPLSAVQKMTVISIDGAGRIPRAVADNVAQGLELLNSTTGVDLAELLKGVAQRTSVTAGEQLNGKAEITH
ncbi:hypothetical protein OG381_04860 [Streptomyces sp. NBC_00490]|uniref:flotillin domain-containing protein n=1 Tax=Streptomyces sp. NBC_00490 TaxID=2903657 RepID=UPI002E180E87